MYRIAVPADTQRLVVLFRDVIEANKAYISHGELQMGIATEVGVLADDAFGKWRGYIEAKMQGCGSRVWVYESDGALLGFVVAEIGKDGDKPFGVICDLVVDRNTRGRGIGKELLRIGLEWLRAQGAEHFYLESGVNNRSAHEFFERQGFRMVSHVFRM